MKTYFVIRKSQQCSVEVENFFKNIVLIVCNRIMEVVKRRHRGFKSEQRKQQDLLMFLNHSLMSLRTKIYQLVANLNLTVN